MENNIMADILKPVVDSIKTESAPKRKQKVTLTQYKNSKIKMLKRDFFIKLSPMEMKHFDKLTSEIQIDNFAKDLLSLNVK